MSTESSFAGSMLVTTDLSETSYAAFPYALEQASASRSLLNIVNVLDAPLISATLYEYVPSPEEIEKIKAGAKAHVEEKLREMSTKQFSGVSTRIAVLEHCGSAADAIVEYAGREGCGLIVIATHGHGLIGRVVLGSIAERVLRHATCPVLVVPCRVEGKKVNATHLPYRNILGTTDFSDASRAALSIAQHEMRRTGATLTVAHVIESLFAPHLFDAHAMLSADRAEEIQSTYRRGLEKRLQEFSGPVGGRALSTSLIDKTYSVPNSIAEFARNAGTDLIVMATRGAGNRINWLGGVTERMVRQSPCPVLVVPPHRAP